MSRIAKMGVDRRREILGVALLGVTALLFLALASDGYDGRIRRQLDEIGTVPNVLGEPGAMVASFLYVLLGPASHLLYCVLCVWGAMLLRHKPLDRVATRLVGLLCFVFSVAALVHVDVGRRADGDPAGGIMGAFFGGLVLPYFGVVGSNVIFVTFAIVGILLSTEFLFVQLCDKLVTVLMLVVHTTVLLINDLYKKHITNRRRAEGFLGFLRRKAGEHSWMLPPAADEGEEPFASHVSKGVDRNRIRIRTTGNRAAARAEVPLDEAAVVEAAASPSAEGAEHVESGDARAETEGAWPQAASGPEPTGTVAYDSVENVEPVVPAREPTKPRSRPMPRRRMAPEEDLPPDYKYPRRYTKPSMDLFEAAAAIAPPNLGEQLLRTSAVLEETLKTFGIEARVTDVVRGPTITRYELEPAPGIKVSRFLALADDLALALKAHRVRVEAPIPGKGRVGIEVPNKDRDPVVVRDLLESKEFRKSKGVLALALGKDIAGDVYVVDLAAMPHLLVAGATGSGKTVCVKTLLASLLFAKPPEELQLMLIDPKMVELSIFNDIPHLITPVVTDPKKAASALNWLIVEMEERYRLFAHLRVRNIEIYNQSVENGEIEVAEPERDGAGSMNAIRKLPYIVCVIDELADLMMLARAEVEDAIGRLAQLARAVGIHLIIATQRPSVDVLTGVIKANFPARMSFQVSSRVDSRCILDEIGAERLVGRGDMLYLPAGQSKPTRIQGAFVSDGEMNGLVAYLKTQAPPQYRDEIARFGQAKDNIEDLTDQDDELFDEAVRVVIETGQASISMVQRRLRVGYTRAARLIDMMELKGIVGPHSGSKAREILVAAPRQDEVA